MLCWFLLCSKVTKLYMYIHSFLKNIPFRYGLSQKIRYYSLCHTVRPHCLSILNVIVSTYYPQTLSPSLSLPPPLWEPQICSLCLWICFCSMSVNLFHLCHILDSTSEWYRMVFVFLTSLSMIVSSCIHVVANGIILFFFVAE